MGHTHVPVFFLMRRRFSSISFLLVVSTFAVKAGNIPSGSLSRSSFTGYIQIIGESSVGEFSLSIDLNDIFVQESTVESDGQKIHSSYLWLPLEEFKSKNIQMKHDFLKLLRADEYPWISVGLQHYLSQIENSERIPLQTTINIAGITKDYTIECQVAEHMDKKFTIQGEESMSMREFNLIPPRKVLGFVEVQEQIKIQFSITFVLNEL